MSHSPSSRSSIDSSKHETAKGDMVKDKTPTTTSAIEKEIEIDHSQAEASSLPQVQAEPQSSDIEKSAATVSERPAEQPPGAFDPRENPDGGRDAWLVVLGGCCCLFCSFGWINCKIRHDNSLIYCKLTSHKVLVSSRTTTKHIN